MTTNDVLDLLAEVDKLREVVALTQRDRDARKRQRDAALAALAERDRVLALVREYVDYPGNWPAYDGRRKLLLRMLDGDGVRWPR